MQLLLIDSGVIIKRLDIDQGRYVIGRSDDTDMMISSKEVSRHHAAIEYDGATCFIQDLESTNGTFVNDRRIKKHALRAGDQITIGDFLLVLDDGTGVVSYPEATEVGQKGNVTEIIEDKFTSLRSKLKDKDLADEFLKIEQVVKKSRKQLSTLAHADKLTGLYNRQYFDKNACKEFRKAQETETPLSVLFIDIDHFKQVNDTHGHKVGDDALRTIAQLIRLSCRKSDMVARYGGEEIVVILPSTSSGDAAVLGKDINSIIAMQTPRILQFKITVSIGVAAYPAHGESLRKVLEHADQALYTAKRAGRDRVVIYSEKRI
jgi:diguanylate cyclase (GGDEF)-like protein